MLERSEASQNREQRFFALLRMTKQRFVIGEFISVTMNEPMLFCFVIGEFISVTMNEPMLFCFVIDEFCSNRSNVALPPLRQ